MTSIPSLKQVALPLSWSLIFIFSIMVSKNQPFPHYYHLILRGYRNHFLNTLEIKVSIKVSHFNPRAPPYVGWTALELVPSHAWNCSYCASSSNLTSSCLFFLFLVLFMSNECLFKPGTCRYSTVALMHIPCYGIFVLIMKGKHSVLSKFESYGYAH